ncbi:hypothetical protein RchiOBHm_Chr5g0026201 [Rosa chinensis]|uniref:Uncharacterized protein n=1 Tax=Rosa chinensis TaxID=74649 RepID=A0A2P6Q8S6_ROSCH|nr:hypothetical protein RchiOBHm_Chr5g0026201 [Rosa chinensis]
MVIYFLFSINLDHLMVRWFGHCPYLRTLRAMSALGRRRVPCFVALSNGRSLLVAE